MKGSSALGGRVDRIPVGHREGRGQMNQGSSHDFGRVTGGTWKDREADLYHTHSLWGTVPKTSQLTDER